MQKETISVPTDVLESPGTDGSQSSSESESSLHRRPLRDLDWDSLSIEDGVALLLNYAASRGASDVFLMCEEHEVAISIRRLRTIEQVDRLPAALGRRFIANIRAECGMPIDEHRHPLDGRWVLHVPNSKSFDLRVNVLPTLHGSSMAIRLLQRDSTLRQIESLGFVGPQLSQAEMVFHSAGGLVLTIGPTGSGKTTTMYGFLHRLNDGRKKIHTIEDPVEYSISGLQQTQVNVVHGPTFAESLQAVLRQGPDVIMIGEIRDQISAQTAVRAASSGQMVFATVHASLAVKAFQSMVSLGADPKLLGASTLAVIGQRLMRTLDRKKSQEIDLSDAPHTFDEVRSWLRDGQGQVVWAPVDDGDGGEAAYTGITGLFEVLMMTPTLQEMVASERPVAEMARKAREEGMFGFRRAALLKVALGETSFDEVFRILPNDDESEDGIF